MKETDILAVKMQMLQQSNWTYGYGFIQTLTPQQWWCRPLFNTMTLKMFTNQGKQMPARLLEAWASGHTENSPLPVNLLRM